MTSTPFSRATWQIAVAWALALGATAAASPNASSKALTVPAAQAATSPAHTTSTLALEVKEALDWIKQSHDNSALHFVIIDKVHARAYAFDPAGQLLGAAPVLLGLAKGDRSVPGIGQRKLADIRPEERTTPAGRFLAERGRNAQGEDIIWVDYDAAVSMHRVRTNNSKERRLERLASATAADNRISYGCINLPPAFFNDVVNPAFGKGEGKGVVYILPETRDVRADFRLGNATSSR